MRRLGTAVGAVFALVLIAAAPALADNPPTIVPAGFTDTAITNADQLEEPVAVQFVPGVSGQFYVAEKSGLVLRFAGPNDPKPIQVIDLRSQVNTVGDRGLLGMALAPSFTSSGGDMYLLYTADAPIGGTPPVWHDQCPDPPGDGGCIVSARLVRVTVDSLGHAGTPVPIIQNQWCEQFSTHSIETVRFGPDGMLYVGAGDGASFNDTDWGQFGDAHNHNVNPCGDPANEGGALRAQDVRTNGDPAGLDGAILRVDTTGAAAAGNPYYSDPDANKARVLAYGFRNPYRFTFRPGTSDIFVGDVGWFTAEEIDKVPVDSTARDYGWPCYEGNGGGQGDYPTVPLCKSLLPSAVTSPVFSYGHGENVAAGDGCDFTAGSAISGMAFNSGTRYPSEYGGGLFFADYSRNCIWFMRKKANGDPDPSTVSVFARGAVEVGGPVDLEVMPNGNIAYVFLGWNGDSQIREIRWSGPKAALTASPTHGSTPLNVHFDAGGSTGDSATYQWDFEGDGNWVGGAATADHQYVGARRAVTARVKVTDVHNDSDIASVRIGVGTNPPATPTIKATVPAGGWAVGDPLKFTGAATDPDGDPLQYTWTLTILHCMVGGLCHTHPYAAATGSSATFTAPDHEWPSRLRVTLTASDGILTSTRSLELSPRGAHLTVRATPSPLKARLGGVEASSVTKTLIAGSATTISVDSPQRLNGLSYTFIGWSDGDRHRVRIVHPRVDTVLTARFQTPPASLAAPAVTGRARTNATQTAADGTWRGNELTLSHRWLRCNALGAACAPIPGAIGVVYQPSQADAGHRLRVIVTASNLLGAASAQSAPSAVLADRTPPEVRVSGKKRRKLGNGRMALKIRCVSERCRVKVSARLVIGGSQTHATKAVKRTIRKGKRATITVPLGTLRDQAAAALGAHQKVKVRFTVTATDVASNRTRRSFTTRLR